jgi:OOP family OmpA-OmpF porin
MNNSKYLLATLIFAAPAVCFAQSPGSTYAGWSAGQSMTKFDSNSNSFGVANLGESYDKSESGLKLFAGRNFSKNWALEGGYAGLGTPKIDYTGTGVLAGTAGRANIKNTAWFFAGKGTLPLSKAIGVFAKLGVTGNKSDFTATTNNAAVNTAAGFPVSKTKVRLSPLVGIGAEFSLTEKFRLRAEYEDFGKFNNDMDAGHTKAALWSIGVTYTFE